MEAVINAEKGVIDFFKQISGEIPISCLTERIRCFLKYVEDKKLSDHLSPQKELTRNNTKVYNAFEKIK